MKNKFCQSAMAIALGLFATGSVYAATQGSLGATSTGTLNITATVNNLVQITNLNDIDLGTFTGTGNLTGNDTLCIYRNGSGTYQITATGSGTGSAFTVTDGSNTLPYTVDYTSDLLGTPTTTTMSTGSALTGQAGVDSASTTCAGGGDNAQVDITISNADLTSAPAGAYSGTLTLVVAPE